MAEEKNTQNQVELLTQRKHKYYANILNLLRKMETFENKFLKEKHTLKLG